MNTVSSIIPLRTSLCYLTCCKVNKQETHKKREWHFALAHFLVLVKWKSLSVFVFDLKRRLQPTFHLSKNNISLKFVLKEHLLDVVKAIQKKKIAK